MESCDSCRYARPCREADRAVAELTMECHRRPPVVVPVQEASEGWTVAGQAWPQVDPEDWCGEYRPAPVDSGFVFQMTGDPPGLPPGFRP